MSLEEMLITVGFMFILGVFIVGMPLMFIIDALMELSDEPDL